MSGIPAGAGSLLGRRLGKYEILALLALGGTAEIYLARIGGAAGFEKYVVVKCLHDHLADDPEFVKMFLDEARLAAHLDHSNIVQTMELGEHENRYYMVMEFLAGLSLAMVVRRAGERLPTGRIPVPMVLNIIAQCSAGLHYAHEKAMNGKPLNIVHRDISPQNLVISFEGVAKIVDFGIAKAELRETRTRSGTIKGKFAYMSPEQCVASNVDRRTDIFALGVIVYELLTGRRLFKRATPYETYQAVMECVLKPPSSQNRELDPELDAIVMRAIAKEKEDRYPTAEAFGDALLGYLHHRGKGSGPGDVGRFFDASFAPEIEEHGGRMRQLISGRDRVVEAGVKWDGDEEARRSESLETIHGHGRRDLLSLDTDDFEPDDRPSRPSVTGMARVLDRFDDDPPADDEIPAEPTRIEVNPLERVNELDKVPVPARTGKTPAPQLLARPQPGTGITVSGALPLPAPPAAPQPESPEPKRVLASPRLPAIQASEFSNLPTLIVDPDPSETGASVPTAPELARSHAGRQLVDANARTTLQMEAPHVGGGRPPSGQQPIQRATGTLAPQPMPRSSLGDLPSSYPVLNAEMSAEMMKGASVFPSSKPQRVPESGAFARPSESGLHDPQRALDVASPVGRRYPLVDWVRAAAAPAKPIAPWLLAVLFTGALTIALVVTILIAKLLR